MIVKLLAPTGIRFSERNMRFLSKRAHRRFRGNISEAVRAMVDAEEEREKERKRKGK